MREHPFQVGQVPAVEVVEILRKRSSEFRRELPDKEVQEYRKGNQAAPVAPGGGVVGVPVDSEYIIFVIDTSGSMILGAWQAVQRVVDETLRVYPTVKGLQVLNDEGRYLFPTFARQWIPDTPQIRRLILQRLRVWRAFSDSNPAEGISTLR